MIIRRAGAQLLAAMCRLRIRTENKIELLYLDAIRHADLQGSPGVCNSVKLQ